jgi:hypothetical protein
MDSVGECGKARAVGGGGGGSKDWDEVALVLVAQETKHFQTPEFLSAELFLLEVLKLLRIFDLQFYLQNGFRSRFNFFREEGWHGTSNQISIPEGSFQRPLRETDSRNVIPKQKITNITIYEISELRCLCEKNWPSCDFL